MRETRTGRIALGDDGVLTVRIDPTLKQTIDDAKENLSAALALRDGKRRPLLIDIRGGQPLEADVRHYYSGQVLVDGFTALGLLVDAGSRRDCSPTPTMQPAG